MSFTAEVWLYPSTAGSWHFVSVPKELGSSIKKTFGKKVRGWGAVPVEVEVGETKWKTSVFPNKKSGSYILPLKLAVRKSESVRVGDKVFFTLTVLV